MIVDMTKGVYRRIYSSATRDRRINQLSLAAELLYWRLHCVADDFGSFEADPYLLLCSVDLRTISSAVSRVVRGGRVGCSTRSMMVCSVTAAISRQG